MKMVAGESGTRRFRSVALLVSLFVLSLPGAAAAHLDRPSYWPDPDPDQKFTVDPRPDFSVTPPAGGKVPTARSLASAVDGKGPGVVRVVCQGAGGVRSLELLERSLSDAVERGYRLRPSQDTIFYSRAQALRLMELNRQFAAQCRYDSIQQAVFDSGNNDRIVIMPGTYTEPKSRSKRTNDPRCDELTQVDQSGREVPSYRYHATCPNDQSLVLVLGRAVTKEPPPSPPRDNRQGIPDNGACIRCNLQIEGSGAKPEDVIIDAGKNYEGKGSEARPRDFAKDVVLRVDRADGFVGRNFLARGAVEHAVYVVETDGVLLDRVKFYWAADYGHLSFATDHQLVQNCDGFGAGDAVVYPGAAPETGEQADQSFYPDAPRINTVIRDCDLRGSEIGYSGSMGNAVRITRNHIYGNAIGITTDSISAAGHPGFPADSLEIDHNLIYSNNFNVFTEDSPVEPTAGLLPVGTGIILAGHNNGRIHDNWIFDNWRRGMMLFAVPDAIVEPEGRVNPGISCQTAPLLTTSCGNQFFDNHMGERPPGFKAPAALKQFDVPNGGDAKALPNGTDFWWDAFPGNTANCWFDNTGPDGTRASLTADPPMSPMEGTSVVGFLPEDCGTSIGAGDVVNEAELANCLLAREEGVDLACDWEDTPPAPGTAAARKASRISESAAGQFLATAEAGRLLQRLHDLGFAWLARLLSTPAVVAAQPSTPGVGPVRAGSVAALAQCRDWNRGTVQQRLATIPDVRQQLTASGAAAGAIRISDEDAFDLFERMCAHDFATGFRLYKVYSRAAAFHSLV